MRIEDSSVAVTANATNHALPDHDFWQSPERFQDLVNSIKDYAIFMLDSEGRIATWNAGAERIKGYTADEIIGHHFSEFYPEDAIRREWPAYELAVAREKGRFEDEAWRIRKDGSRFWANVVITAVYDSNDRLRGFSKVTRDLTERRRAEMQLRAAHSELEERIRERTIELSHANATLTAEIAERNRLEQRLRTIVNQLQDVDRNKNEFLAILAHELRNPLAPICNAVEFLKLQGVGRPELERACDIIERQARQMTRLVDELLDLSRISHNTLQLFKEPTDLTVALQSAIEVSRPFLEVQRQQLRVTFASEPTYLDIDLTRIAQVFANLLNNASKFTPVEGQISLTVESMPGQVDVTVADNGIGISADKLESIFEMFEQGPSDSQRAPSGLGIGLTLARRLVELHGGTIEAFSPGLGLGSQFRVRLPRISVEIDSAPPSDLESGSEEIAEPISRPLSRRVLIVDDNDDSAHSLCMILRSLGNEVQIGRDGIEAVELANEYRPDVVLLDIGMPRMDGHAAARQIRAQEWGRDMLLIAMTGWGQDEDKQRTKRAGFDHHLIKPIDPVILRAILAGDGESK